MKFSILSMFQYFTVQIVSSFYDKQMKSYFSIKKSHYMHVMAFLILRVFDVQAMY